MTVWTSNELTEIGTAEELQIASLRRDGTLRKLVTIWVVRSVNGRAGAWYRGAQVRHEGHIRAGGIDKDVTFVEEAGPAINGQVDDAYRAKYRHYGERIVGSIVSAGARAATIKFVPRSTGI